MKKIVRIVSPAKAIESEYIDFAKSFLESQNFIVEIGRLALGKSHYFSGSDQDRASDFQTAIDDDNVDIILCARGGYGSIRIIDQLDFSNLKKRAKLIVGFSDITVFHHHIHRHLTQQTIHASMPLNFKKNSPESLQTLVNSMRNIQNNYKIESHADNILGQASGQLIGGNLATIYALIGTNSDVNFDHKILFIEDVGEYKYAIDRMLWALTKAKKLQKLKGLIVGGMTNIKDTEVGFGASINEIIIQHVKSYDYPVTFSFPAGHVDDNRALVFGKECKLDVNRTSVTLSN